MTLLVPVTTVANVTHFKTVGDMTVTDKPIQLLYYILLFSGYICKKSIFLGFDDFSGVLLKSLTLCCIQRRNFLKLGYSSTIKSVMKCTMHFSTISSSRQQLISPRKISLQKRHGTKETPCFMTLTRYSFCTQQLFLTQTIKMTMTQF